MTDSRNVADFLGEDGCLWCGVCGKRKQLRINFMGRDRVVGCLCDCEVQARKERAAPQGRSPEGALPEKIGRT